MQPQRVLTIVTEWSSFVRTIGHFCFLQTSCFKSSWKRQTYVTAAPLADRLCEGMVPIPKNLSLEGGNVVVYTAADLQLYKRPMGPSDNCGTLPTNDIHNNLASVYFVYDGTTDEDHTEAVNEEDGSSVLVVQVN